MNKIRRATEAVVGCAQGIFSALKDPSVVAALNKVLDEASKAAAERSLAGQAQRVLHTATSPAVLSAVELALMLSTKGLAPKGVLK